MNRTLVTRLQRMSRIAARGRSVRVLREAVATRSTMELDSFLRQGGRIKKGDLTYREAPIHLKARYWRALTHIPSLVDAGFTITIDQERFAVTAENILIAGEIDDIADALYTMVERFVVDEYAPLDVQDAVVLDIGGFIGDSAVYFARRGAQLVYCFEPFLRPYRQAKVNVANNAQRGQVRLFHAGIDAHASITSGTYNRTSGFSSRIGPGESGIGKGSPAERLRMLSFAGIVDALVRRHPDARLIAKIDCEGSEFRFLTTDAIPDALARFELLLIEYHDLPPDPIISALEGLGFQVGPDPRPLDSQLSRNGLLLARRAARER